MKHQNAKLNSLLKESLNDFSYLLDSSKTLGKPVQINDETIIVPVTRLTFGFGSGGSEFGKPTGDNNPLEIEAGEDIFPYGGGTLGGVAIRPEAFLVITKEGTKVVKMDERSLYAKALDMLLLALKNRK